MGGELRAGMGLYVYACMYAANTVAMHIYV